MAAFRAPRTVIQTLVAGFLLLASCAAAGPAGDSQSCNVPLRRVVLFTSGVGFFEHRGEIDGDQSMQMEFEPSEINDLLKSMVVQDLRGGQVSAVTYESQDPIARTLQTYAIDLTSNPGIGQLLQQVRGHRIRVSAGETFEGVILGMESRRMPVGEEVPEVDVLNIKTAEGLRSLPMHEIKNVRLLDEKLDQQLQEALALLAASQRREKKTVQLRFQGKGKRTVMLGYIREFPVWKTSYRLVVQEDQPPFLQGWAIVENTTEQDWSDVKLSLVSGRPISFVMELYVPLYVQRPQVVPELFSSLRPRIYGQDLLAGATAGGRLEGAGGMGMGGMGGGGGAAMGGFGGMPGAAEAEKEAREATLDLEKGVSTAASGAEVGELFRYEIQPPVSLPRQKSTMLPIVNQQIQGEKVSIYNLQVEPKHPLNGLQITNTTDLHLMQGPITVFDGGEYAGDARIADVPPGGKRLISYALDLDVEVADEPPEGPKDREAAKRPDETCLAKFERFAGAVIGQAPSQRSRELVQVRLLKGVVLVNYRLKRSHRYLVKNAGAKSKRVLVEQQIDADWKLVSPPKPEEKTGDLYRFAVQVAAGESEALIVEEEQLIHEEIKVDSIPDGQVALFLKSSEVSAGVKTALSELVKHKRALADLAEQRRLLETRVTSISQEQTRIRQNIQNLDRTGDLYGRYVRRLEEQEDELEKLHAQMEKLQADEASQRKAFDERLLKLDLS